MLRALQCVALPGLLSNVRVTTRSASASLILRGWPGRGASARPARRRRAQRTRHLPTAGMLSFMALAACVLILPLARSSTTRQR